MVESIEELEAGEKLDAWVARKVFGHSVYRAQGRYCFSPHDAATGITQDVCLPVAAYSTDIKAAWEVVEVLRARNRDTAVSITAQDGDAGSAGYYCNVEDVSDGIDEWEAHALTAPLAICRAALKVFA
jgi:hypothetical protein